MISSFHSGARCAGNSGNSGVFTQAGFLPLFFCRSCRAWSKHKSMFFERISEMSSLSCSRYSAGSALSEASFSATTKNLSRQIWPSRNLSVRARKYKRAHSPAITQRPIIRIPSPRDILASLTSFFLQLLLNLVIQAPRCLGIFAFVLTVFLPSINCGGTDTYDNERHTNNNNGGNSEAVQIKNLEPRKIAQDWDPRLSY